jgi:hypothetical protein
VDQFFVLEDHWLAHALELAFKVQLDNGMHSLYIRYRTREVLPAPPPS